MISGAEVRINGQPLDPKLHDRLVEVRVQDNLRLPDSALIRVSDPGLENVDSIPLEIGAEIEILLAAIDASSLTSVFEGRIAALEPEFSASGTVLAARAYDGSHLLHQTKRTQTFQNMTAGDIAKKVAQKQQLALGTIESAGLPHDFVQQSNETDWEFLWRLASRIDFEVLVTDKKLHFRKAGAPPEAHDLTLRWGEQLLSFRPRVTSVQQVSEVVVRAWDPIAKRTIEATEKIGKPSSEIGIARDKIVNAAGGDSVTVADRPVFSADEARELAKSFAAHLGNAYVEAEGSCKGNPRLRAGTKITVEGVGKRYGGTYTASATTHVFRGSHGYLTYFAISGRAPRNLVDLMTPAATRSWGSGVVIGTVTQTEDPQSLGRVRVSYPALGDETESGWARIVSPAAGDRRGLLMMPLVGDEVLVAFEHGDVHKPYVIGSLWNGKGKPSDLVHKDGSFALASDKAVAVNAKEDISLKAGKDYLLQTGGKLTAKANGDIQVEGSANITLKGGTSLTIEGGTDISIKCGLASISLNSTGTVQVSGSQIMLG
jgi:phage protein D